MRLRATSSAALVVSLLANDALAGVHRAGHQAYHGKRVPVIDDVIVTETITDYVTVMWPPVEPTTTTSLTTTSIISSTVASSSSAVPVPVIPAAVPNPAPIAAAAVQPTTLVKLPTPSPAPVASSSAAPVAKPAAAAVVAPAVQSPPASSSPASSPSQAPSSPPGSCGKRGSAYAAGSDVNAFDNSKVCWAYNWASESNTLSSSFEFMPMLWSDRADFTSVWDSNVKAALAKGSKHILGFNEPDHPDQAKMTPGQAVTAWKQYIEPYAGQAMLISPAVTNGQAPMGFAWTKQFLDGCTDCNIGCIACHWYDSATNIQYFKDYMQQASDLTGGKIPVCLTEFGASGSLDQQNQFLETVLPWMDQQSFVYQYSYFMTKDGILLNGKSLNTLGSTFASFT